MHFIKSSFIFTTLLLSTNQYFVFGLEEVNTHRHEHDNTDVYEMTRTEMSINENENDLNKNKVKRDLQNEVIETGEIEDPSNVVPVPVTLPQEENVAQMQNQQQLNVNDPSANAEQGPVEHENQNQQMDQSMNMDPTDQQQHQQPNQPNETYSNNENGATVPLPILVMGVIVASFMIRKKLMENNLSTSSNTHVYQSLTRGMVGNSWNSGFLSNANASGEDDSDLSDEYSYGVSVATTKASNNTRRRQYSQEMVQLSSAKDDEWSWEDRNANHHDIELGDVSLSTNHSSSLTTNNKDEIHHHPLDLAVSLNNNNNHHQKYEKESQGEETNIVHHNHTTNPSRPNDNFDDNADADSWDDESAEWEEHEPSNSSSADQVSAVPTSQLPHTTTSASKFQAFTSDTSKSIPSTPVSKPTTATISTTNATDTIEDILKNNFAGTTITSLTNSNNNNNTTSDSAVKQNKKKKKIVKEKKEEEDLFASMGLSTLPASTTQKKTPVNFAKKQSVFPSLAVDDGDGSLTGAGEGQWDDDGDLDDLLED